MDPVDRVGHPRHIDGRPHTWLFQSMRVALIVAVAALAACAVDPGPSSVECTSRFDCASSEMCRDGLCVAMERVITRTPKDAGVVGSPLTDAGQPGPTDSGVSTPVDSGVPVTIADAGMSSAPPDSGCNTGITVVELAGQQFCSIAEAITAAPSGGTIDIPSGTYEESLAIDKSVSLRGSTTSPATIHAVAGQPVLSITGTEVGIYSVALQANGADGVEISGTVLIQDSTVKESTGIGIYIAGQGAVLNTRNTLVSRVHCAGACTQMEWGEGIAVGPGASALLIDTIIEDTDFIGLYADGSVVRMENGWVRRAGRTRCPSDLDACLPGVYLANGASGTLVANTWVQESGGSGIDAVGATLDVRDSRVENNGIDLSVFVDGVHLDNSNATLLNDEINGNLGYGVGCMNNVSVSSCPNNNHVNNVQGWTSGTCVGC